MSSSLDNKLILVTGGTGTIGRQVVRELLTEGARIIVYSRDQNKQFKMNHDHESSRIVYKNGDILDPQILSRAMKDVDYVVHAAAAKHVPLCETNADNAIRVNVEGTRNVLSTSARWGVKKVLHISTDKAVNPTSVMGATKFLAERLVKEYSRILPCSIIRLGNVFASNGSVVPTFQDRIKNNLPLVVNNPAATRYFITIKEAGKFIVDRLKDMEGGEIYVKKMKVMTIMSLAEVMSPKVGYPIEIGDMTPGEKLKEMLITQDESRLAYDEGEFITVGGKTIGLKNIDPKVEFFTKEEIKEMLDEIFVRSAVL